MEEAAIRRADRGVTDERPRTSFAVSSFVKRPCTHPTQKPTLSRPNFGMETDMKSRYLIAVGAVLLAVVGMTIAQPPKVGLTPAGGAGALPPPNEPTALGKGAKPEDMT